MSRTIVLAVALLAGCSVTSEATYYSDVGAANCNRKAQCDPDAFAESYEGGVSECVSERDDNASDVQACLDEHCEAFDLEEATDAILDIAKADCEDVDSLSLTALSKGYDSCNGVALVFCVGESLF